MVIAQEKEKNFYLIQGSLGIIRADLNDRRSDCFVCTIPTYRACLVPGTTLSKFLELFNGETVTVGSVVHDLTSNELVDGLDGDIVCCMRNGLPNRIYFELADEESIKRLR